MLTFSLTDGLKTNLNKKLIKKTDFFPMLPPVYSQNVSPFGPTVSPALANIYTNIYLRRTLLYRSK